MGHGLKDVQKHITPWAVVITSLLVRDKPIGVPASVKRVYLQNILIHESISRAAHKRLPHGVCCICANLCIRNHQVVSMYCQMRHSYFCIMTALFGEKCWLYYHIPIVPEEPFHKYCPLSPVHVFDSLSWNGQHRHSWSHTYSGHITWLLTWNRVPVSYGHSSSHCYSTHRLYSCLKYRSTMTLIYSGIWFANICYTAEVIIHTWIVMAGTMVAYWLFKTKQNKTKHCQYCSGPLFTKWIKHLCYQGLIYSIWLDCLPQIANLSVISFQVAIVTPVSDHIVDINIGRVWL